MSGIICDRCGNAIEEDRYRAINISIEKNENVGLGVYGGGIIPETFHSSKAVCNTCFREFKRFIRGDDLVEGAYASRENMMQKARMEMMRDAIKVR